MNTTKKVTVTDDEGGETEHELPAKFEVCSRCEGHSTHLNPSIGQHAYSQEEFEEAFSDPEEREVYFKRGGMYDVTCEECRGQRVVAVVDEEAVKRTPDLKAVYDQWVEQEEHSAAFDREWRREQEMEARMLGEWDG
jgi:hypothetical protein